MTIKQGRRRTDHLRHHEKSHHKTKSEDSAGVVPPREGRISSRKRPQAKKNNDFMVAGKAIFWLVLILAGGLGILYGFAH